MTLATGPIWKMPNTQEHPKMKSWAKAFNVSNLGAGEGRFAEDKVLGSGYYPCGPYYPEWSEEATL